MPIDDRVGISWLSERWVNVGIESSTVSDDMAFTISPRDAGVSEETNRVKVGSGRHHHEGTQFLPSIGKLDRDVLVRP